MKKIFEPFEAHNFKAKNRLVRSATWENLATPEGGICANSYALYDELAAGGIGTIITGFTSVDVNDRYFGGMMRLCNDTLVPEYKKLTDIIKKHDVTVITQLALEQFDFNFVKLLWRPFLGARAKVSEKIYFFRETPARMVENLKNFQLNLL